MSYDHTDDIAFTIGVDAGGAGAVWVFKEVLKAAGWTVDATGTGDGGYCDPVDMIDSPSAMNVLHAYFVLAAPDDSFHLCVQRVENDSSYRVKRSVLGFDFPEEATITPPAADEVVVIGGGSNDSPTGQALFTGSGQLLARVAADSASPFSFYLISHADVAPASNTLIQWEALATWPGPEAPTFAGATHVTAVTSSVLQVEWAAGSDEATPAAELEYAIHVSTEPSAPFSPRAYSDKGALIAYVSGLVPEVIYYVRVRCRDTEGNLSADTNPEFNILMPADVFGAPHVAALSPAENTAILPTQAVSFVVTDSADFGLPAGFRRVIITVAFRNTGITEVAYDGDGWTTMYLAQSVREVSIFGGLSFSIRRAGGWPDSPHFKVYAIDKAGNEASTLGGLPS